jgi:hypothetical protein
VTIRFDYRVPIDRPERGLRAFLTEHLGSQPPHVEIPIPYARRTNDFHMYMKAPPTHYFAEQWAFAHHEGSRLPRALPRLKHARSADVGPQAQTERKAVCDAHVLVVDGSQSTAPLSVATTIVELPLGSIAAAGAAAMIITLTIGLLLLARHFGSDVQSSDIPALLALIPSAIALTSSLFQQGEPSAAAVLSKIALSLSSLLGICFAAWWVYAMNGSGQAKNKFAIDVAKNGGVFLFWISFGVLAYVSIRSLRVMWTYSRVRKGKRPFLLKRGCVKLVLKWWPGLARKEASEVATNAG